MLAAMPSDAVVNRHLRHWRSVRRDPECVVDRFGPASGRCRQQGAMHIQIYAQWINQLAGPQNLQWRMRFGLACVETDQPRAVNLDEISIEPQARKIAPSQRYERQQRDNQTVAMKDGGLKTRGPGRLLHQRKAESEQLVGEL